MSPLPTIGTSSSGGLSASYLNQLIADQMSLQRQPLTILKKQQDDLQIRRAVYSDLKTALESLKTEVQKLETGSTSVLARKSVSVSDTSYLTATASSTAGAGSYDIEVTQLAEAHQVRSKRMDRTDTELGFAADTFYLGGEKQRTTDTPAGSELIQQAANQGADPATGYTELSSGDYYLEFQKQDNAWMFRLVDRQGQAVNIHKAGATDEYTTGWQKFENADSGEFDTGRGLKVSLGSVDQLTTDIIGSTAANKVTYHAKGAAVSVGPDDTLQTLRDKINGATYVPGNEVSASIVDNQLILSARNTGYRLEASDGASTPLAKLDLVGNGDGDGDGWSHTLAGWDSDARAVKVAKVNIGSMTGLTAWSNTGITNLIDGVTLNLTKKTSGPVKVTVADDNASVTNQINAVTTRFNQLTAYLSEKTSVTKGTDGAYTYGALATDSVFDRLRMDLISGMVRPLDSGSLKSLREIGITVNVDTMQFSVSDSTKLASQMQTNRQGVVDLLSGVMKRVEDRLNMFTGDTGVLASSVKRLDSDDKALSKQQKDMEARLADQEMVLTRQYARLLAMYADAQNQASYVYGLSSTLSSIG